MIPTVPTVERFWSSNGPCAIPGAIHILQLDATGNPHEVFSGEFIIVDISDLEKDGTKELIGLPDPSQVWGPYESYSPYFVYKFCPKTPALLSYSLHLSFLREYRRCPWSARQEKAGHHEA